MAESLLDAIAGGLLGVAAGDALGATVEFMTPKEIEEEYGVHREIIGGSELEWRPGQGTRRHRPHKRSIASATTTASSRACDVAALR